MTPPLAPQGGLIGRAVGNRPPEEKISGVRELFRVPVGKIGASISTKPLQFLIFPVPFGASRRRCSILPGRSAARRLQCFLLPPPGRRRSGRTDRPAALPMDRNAQSAASRTSGSASPNRHRRARRTSGRPAGPDPRLGTPPKNGL